MVRPQTTMPLLPPFRYDFEKDEDMDAKRLAAAALGDHACRH